MAKQIASREKDGLAKVTAAKFDEAVERCAKHEFVEINYVCSPKGRSTREK
jgi:hypothetical protein